MKGTLFSADFIKDRDDNFRLLELNTDTAFTSGALAHTDYTDFINLISSSNISELYVIYKDYFHKTFVDNLSQSIAASGYINSFNLIEEDLNTIYPTEIADSSDRFILRCAYDESAIFDSVYCKQNNQIYELFSDNSDSGSVAEFYYSSSNSFYDNLYRGSNTDILPDVLVKDLSYAQAPLEFYKIKGTGSVESNFNNFISEIGAEKLIVNYYEHTSEVKHKAYRSFNIIYGDNLDIINIADVETEAIFNKPLSVSFDTSSVVNVLDKKHYYEFTSNYPKFNATEYQGGVFEDVTIIDVSGSAVEISQTVEGGLYKALLISGSPNTDNPDEYTSWFYSGSVFPSTIPTSSILVSKVEYDLSNKLVSNITLDNGSSFRVNPVQTIVVYDGELGGFKYKSVFDIDPNIDKMIKSDQSLAIVSSSIFEVLEQDHKVYVLDMEETDAFLLYDSDISVNLISHNACFPAGTKILTDNGYYKSIEEIKQGDKLRSFNTITKEFEIGVVGSLHSSTQNKLLHIVTDSGNTIKSTPGHMFYANDEWRIAAKLTEGDKLINAIGEEVEIVSIEPIEGEVEVFHIVNVEDNFNYFAEDLLVHNFSIRCFVAGTKITLADGSSKNIEEIEVGETVLTFNEKTKIKEPGIVGDLKQHSVESIIRLTLDNEIIINTTEEHPFYVMNKGWVKAKDLQPLDSCLKVNGEEAIVSTVDHLIESNVVYNLLSVDSNHNFYANDILVHNK